MSGLCLEIHDLVLSKWAAGRGKDLDVRAATRHRLVDEATLLRRLEDMPISLEGRVSLRESIKAAFRGQDHRSSP